MFRAYTGLQSEDVLYSGLEHKLAMDVKFVQTRVHRFQLVAHRLSQIYSINQYHVVITNSGS